MQQEQLAEQLAARLERPILAILADLDGVLTSGTQWRVPAALFARLQAYADAQPADPAIPRLAFNTGRPQPYVECMARHAHVSLPSLCEHGLVLWGPPGHELLVHPKLPASDLERMARVRRIAAERAALPGCRYHLEAGKIAEVTLIPRRPVRTEELVPEAEEIAALAGGGVRIDATFSVLTFMPPLLDKGAGMGWWCETTGIPAGQVAAVGDSWVDWSFLREAAVSFAPSNAVEEIRARVHIASDCRFGDVVLEMFEVITAANRRILARSGAEAPCAGAPHDA
ncbi:MAG: HAD hydrolase family protein [Candidatus Sumerlaeia bacterium]|nr:HAD hydrolase family protein [Candidatus Sumerlaeia bacterium]